MIIDESEDLVDTSKGEALPSETIGNLYAIFNLGRLAAHEFRDRESTGFTKDSLYVWNEGYTQGLNDLMEESQSSTKQ